jgi:hypothetical protein
MKPSVQTRNDDPTIHLVLPEVLSIIKQKLGPKGCFNLTKLRKDIAEKEATSIDHSGTFQGTQRRCVKVPRKLICEEALNLIDKGIDIMNQ